MCIGLSDILAPLPELTSNKLKFKCNDEHQKFSNTVKRIIGREVLLAYPDFNILFEIHINASTTQLGSIISQHGNPIDFYSRKLKPYQHNYTTTEHELLSIVKTLKGFRNILLGHKIVFHTYHKILTYKNFNTERAMRWRLVIKEFSCKHKYITGKKNVIANAFSRLEFTPDTTKLNISECFRYDDEDLLPQSYSIRYYDIAKEQNKYKDLLSKLNSQKDYEFITFHGGAIKLTT